MIKDAPSFYRTLKEDFPHVPTTKQDILLQQLSHYLFDTDFNRVFLLKGFAGTGKTTIIGSLVKNLWQAQFSSVLMAPTGREIGRAHV